VATFTHFLAHAPATLFLTAAVAPAAQDLEQLAETVDRVPLYRYLQRHDDIVIPMGIRLIPIH